MQLLVCLLLTIILSFQSDLCKKILIVYKKYNTYLFVLIERMIVNMQYMLITPKFKNQPLNHSKSKKMLVDWISQYFFVVCLKCGNNK